jgi:hypothetical protein
MRITTAIAVLAVLLLCTPLVHAGGRWSIGFHADSGTNINYMQRYLQAWDQANGVCTVNLNTYQNTVVYTGMRGEFWPAKDNCNGLDLTKSLYLVNGASYTESLAISAVYPTSFDNTRVGIMPTVAVFQGRTYRAPSWDFDAVPATAFNVWPNSNEVRIMRMVWCGEELRANFNKNTALMDVSKLMWDDNLDHCDYLGPTSDLFSKTISYGDAIPYRSRDPVRLQDPGAYNSDSFRMNGYASVQPTAAHPFTLPLESECLGGYKIVTRKRGGSDWPIGTYRLERSGNLYSIEKVANRNTINVVITLNAQNKATDIRVNLRDSSYSDGGILFDLYCINPGPRPAPPGPICNNNQICEENRGESITNCPSDCQPHVCDENGDIRCVEGIEARAEEGGASLNYFVDTTLPATCTITTAQKKATDGTFRSIENAKFQPRLLVPGVIRQSFRLMGVETGEGNYTFNTACTTTCGTDNVCNGSETMGPPGSSLTACPQDCGCSPTEIYGTQGPNALCGIACQNISIVIDGHTYNKGGCANELPADATEQGSTSNPRVCNNGQWCVQCSEGSYLDASGYCTRFVVGDSICRADLGEPIFTSDDCTAFHCKVSTAPSECNPINYEPGIACTTCTDTECVESSDSCDMYGCVTDAVCEGNCHGGGLNVICTPTNTAPPPEP